MAGPKHITDTIENTIFVETCRACTSCYTFRLAPEVTVIVLCGRPPPSTIYKAVSYVWERDESDFVDLHCQKCQVLKKVPVRDADKLRRILKFVSTNSSCTIWLDALSIDQDDPNDKKAQLGIMGDIYLKSQIVSILLPRGDENAYVMLRDLGVLSQAIINRRQPFAADSTNTSDPAFTELAEAYTASMDMWISNLIKWKYWQRAWTFQEWTMASEVEIACEMPPHNEILKSIKNIIAMAATQIGQHTITEALAEGFTPESIPYIVKVREENGAFLNRVRLHFPVSFRLSSVIYTCTSLLECYGKMKIGSRDKPVGDFDQF